MKIKEELREFADKEKIPTYKNFHKTKEGTYAHGEEFLGITVSNIRKVALNNLDISYEDLIKLLSSNVHEEKYVAAEVLVGKYKKNQNKKEIFDFYIKNAGKLSGWDLVDTSASRIVGDYLASKDKSVLYELANSENLWKKRIAIVSTFEFIKNNEFEDTLKISEILLNDKHDLIHKAVGWMLREVGKKDEKVLEKFLEENYKRLPRTTLRYAIERFPEEKRKNFLRGKFI